MTHASLGTGTAAVIVAASMVGTGVFTTSGYLLADGLSPAAILLGWALGGAISLAGALAYAELGAAFPESGGEYALLTRIVHPFVGFQAGFASVTVGVAAPVAACAVAFARYGAEALATVVPGATFPQTPVAAALVVGCAAAHARSVRLGARFLAGVTAAQMTLCVLLAGVGLAHGVPERLSAGTPVAGQLATPAFASALVWISFAYAGWNAAIYVGAELRDPARTLPRAMLGATAFVTALYAALNAGILMAAPADTLRGEVAVAHAAAAALLGPLAAAAVSGIVAFGLVGSVSAFLLSGSRIAEVMARDHAGLAFLAGRSGHDGGPARALLGLVALTGFFLATSTFDQLVTFTGVVLQLFAMATVAAALVDRVRAPDRPRPFRVPALPLVAAAFLVPSAWSVLSVIRHTPYALLGTAAMLGLGAVGWVAGRLGAPPPPAGARGTP